MPRSRRTTRPDSRSGRRVFGPRFLLGGALVVGAAVAGVFADLSTVWAVGLVLGTLLVVTVVEWSLAWTPTGPGAARVEVRGSEPQTRLLDSAATPQPEPEPEAKRDYERVPEREPQPQPVSGSEPQAPEPAPRPEPEPEPEPELPPAATAPPPAHALDGPREWNVWDLERIARARGRADIARAEERSFLLMYLRAFAEPDGQLPDDFDALVRDSFGDLLVAARP
ncbi:MAG TPA: hypothetical protein VF101_18575 [Gaiellaceae bacterium]